MNEDDIKKNGKHLAKYHFCNVKNIDRFESCNARNEKSAVPGERQSRCRSGFTDVPNNRLASSRLCRYTGSKIQYFNGKLFLEKRLIN